MLGSVRRSNIVIHQKEFVFLRTVKSLLRAHPMFLKSRRLRSGIRVESCIPHDFAIAGPKSDADYFVGVGFFGDRVRARTLRRASPRKARHRQIAAAPEELDRADLANQS